MPTNKTVEQYIAKANTIIEHYDALTNVVRATLFPWNFVASSTLPDTTHWSKTKKTVMMLIMPLYIFDHIFDKSDDTAQQRLFSLLLWLLIYVFYYGFGLAILFNISQANGLTSSTSGQSSSMSPFVAWSLVILFVAIAVLVYSQVVWYLFNKKTSRKNRFVWIGLFVVISYFSYLEIVDTVPNFSTLLSTYDVIRIVLLFSIAVFWIPTTIMTVSLLLILGRLVLYTIFSMLIYFVKANSPNYSFLVKSILPKAIGNGDNDNIFSLPISEVVALRNWAQINLETTEKRTIPAIIFLAILGAIAAFSKVQDSLYNSLTAFISLFNRILDNFLKSPQDFITYLATFATTVITLLIILSIVTIYIRLLNNLFVQGVVVEVCTVAEYAKREVERETELVNKNSQYPWYINFLKWMLDYIQNIKF